MSVKEVFLTRFGLPEFEKVYVNFVRVGVMFQYAFLYSPYLLLQFFID